MWEECQDSGGSSADTPGGWDQKEKGEEGEEEEETLRCTKENQGPKNKGPALVLWQEQARD